MFEYPPQPVEERFLLVGGIRVFGDDMVDDAVSAQIRRPYSLLPGEFGGPVHGAVQDRGGTFGW